jgi:hypothetical protein
MGMAEFLFRKRVPDVPSPLCSCAQAPETPEHVLFYCRETMEKREEVRNVIAPTALRTRRDLAQLFLKYPGLVAEWLLQTGRFMLYNKARKLQQKWNAKKLANSDQATAAGIDERWREAQGWGSKLSFIRYIWRENVPINSVENNAWERVSSS